MSEAGSTTEAELKDRLKNEFWQQLQDAKRLFMIAYVTVMVVVIITIGVTVSMLLTRLNVARVIDVPEGVTFWVGPVVGMFVCFVALLLYSLIERVIDAQRSYSSLQ